MKTILSIVILLICLTSCKVVGYVALSELPNNKYLLDSRIFKKGLGYSNPYYFKRDTLANDTAKLIEIRREELRIKMAQYKKQ